MADGEVMADAHRTPINQTAFVTTDMEAAIDFWTGTMGVGPFFVFPPLEPVKGDYRGDPTPTAYAAAIAYSGDLIVELIVPQGPCIFQEFLDRGGKGVQHLAAFADDMAAARAGIEEKGGKRLQGSTFADGSEVAYFAMTPDESIILEIAALKPESRALFAAIKAAGAAWDGRQRTMSL
jgi:catechol 2,3-dioxygenase-like lactoylglutathione lyase family enzyme